jgi:hypothetical protein
MSHTWLRSLFSAVRGGAEPSKWKRFRAVASSCESGASGRGDQGAQESPDWLEVVTTVQRNSDGLIVEGGWCSFVACS